LGGVGDVGGSELGGALVGRQGLVRSAWRSTTSSRNDCTSAESGRRRAALFEGRSGAGEVLLGHARRAPRAAAPRTLALGVAAGPARPGPGPSVPAVVQLGRGQTRRRPGPGRGWRLVVAAPAWSNWPRASNTRATDQLELGVRGSRKVVAAGPGRWLRLRCPWGPRPSSARARAARPPRLVVQRHRLARRLDGGGPLPRDARARGQPRGRRHGPGSSSRALRKAVHGGRPTVARQQDLSTSHVRQRARGARRRARSEWARAPPAGPARPGRWSSAAQPARSRARRRPAPRAPAPRPPGPRAARRAPARPGRGGEPAPRPPPGGLAVAARAVSLSPSRTCRRARAVPAGPTRTARPAGSEGLLGAALGRSCSARERRPSSSFLSAWANAREVRPGSRWRDGSISC